MEANHLERPQVVVHNSVSVDGSVTGFEPDLGQHYAAVGPLDVDANLIGSITMATGLDADTGEPEPDPGPDSDRPPRGREGLNRWFVVDSSARLHGRLHQLRAFPFLRDVVMLISDATPPVYVDYLTERRYDHFRCGEDRVDLPAALRWMAERYGVRRVSVDSGPILVTALLAQDLVDELSLLVHPLIAGAAGRRMFDGLEDRHDLRLLSAAGGEAGVVHLRYSVTRP